MSRQLPLLTPENYGAEIEPLARTIARVLLPAPADEAQLAESLRIKPGHIRRGLRYLRHRNIVVELPGRRYSLTADGASWLETAEVAQ